MYHSPDGSAYLSGEALTVADILAADQTIEGAYASFPLTCAASGTRSWTTCFPGGRAQPSSASCTASEPARSLPTGLVARAPRGSCPSY